MVFKRLKSLLDQSDKEEKESFWEQKVQEQEREAQKRGRGRPRKEEIMFEKESSLGEEAAAEKMPTEGQMPGTQSVGEELSVKSSDPRPVLIKALKTVLKVLAFLFVGGNVLLLFPFNLQNMGSLKNASFAIPYLLPIIFFLILLSFGLKSLFERKLSLKKSTLSLGVILFCIYFLLYIPFSGRNLFSFLYLNPLIYVLAPLSFFLLSRILGSVKGKKNLLIAVIVAACAVFLVTNPAMRSFYNDVLKIKVSKIPVLSLGHSWEIGMETLKRKPLFGMGPGNYELAFTLYKPIGINSTDNWTYRFDSAGSLFFQITTLGGFLGLALLVLLLLIAIRKFPFSQNPILGGFYVLALALTTFLIPFSLPLLFFFFLLLAVSISLSKEEEIVVSGKVPIYVIASLAGLLFLFGEFFFVKVTIADYYYQQAQFAKLENKGADTYNLLLEAIKRNPNSDLYHRDYAQVNLLLANSLASQTNLDDTGKTQVQTLLSQAIRESQVITQQTNPNSAVNWELRGQIYRSMIGVVQNAEQWSADAFLQSIQLDPLNPLIKVDLGGIYFQAKNYEDAKTLFVDATRVKPDYANAYYNLAYTLKAQNDVNSAVTRLTQALGLIDQTSADYTKASQELADWKKEAGITDTSTQETQTTQPSDTSGQEETGNYNPEATESAVPESSPSANP